MPNDDINCIIFGIFSLYVVTLFRENNISWKEEWLYVSELLIFCVHVIRMGMVAVDVDICP